jgi:hypothetical protein
VNHRRKVRSSLEFRAFKKVLEWALRTDEGAWGRGLCMVTPFIVFIVKARRGAFLWSALSGLRAILNSEAFTNLSATFQMPSKMSFQLFQASQLVPRL